MTTPGPTYVPRRTLAVLRGSRLPLLLFFAAVAAAALLDEGVQALELGFVAVMVPVLVVPVVRRVRKPPPFVVDRRGITFADAGDGAGERLVPWESMTGVVLFERASTSSTRRRRERAIGVQLIGHPDGVSVQRGLHGWSVDRRAVAAFADRYGGVRVLDGPSAPSAGPMAGELRSAIREAAAEASSPVPPAARAAWPRYGAETGWRRPGRYRPAAPDAYLARAGWHSNLAPWVTLLGGQAFIWIFLVPEAGAVGVVFAVGFAVPLVFLARQAVTDRGEVVLAVDAPGVYFAEYQSAGHQQDPLLVPWSEIGAVVVFDQLVGRPKSDQWKAAVGVRLRGGDTVRFWRATEGWRLDRPALEAAVARFATGVKVIDGPPQRPPSFADAFDVLRQAYEEHRRDG